MHAPARRPGACEGEIGATIERIFKHQLDMKIEPLKKELAEIRRDIEAKLGELKAGGVPYGQKEL
eukprot:3520245-Alexandrium_andersonii.AAC.1